eukprot:scaffold70351_cov36-Tisochrysis_lutea.AAC.1
MRSLEVEVVVVAGGAHGSEEIWGPLVPRTTLQCGVAQLVRLASPCPCITHEFVSKKVMDKLGRPHANGDGG